MVKMNFDWWAEDQRITQVVIGYSWEAFGLPVFSAYEAWWECKKAARRVHLQNLGVESLGPWESEKTIDYDINMCLRLEDAKHRYLLGYVRQKLPQTAYQKFSTMLMKGSGQRVSF